MSSAKKPARSRRADPGAGPTDKMREYLEIIYYLAMRRERVIAARLADWMGVSAPTVTDLVRRLEEHAYITRDSRGEISLTPEGFHLAEAMVRRHRLLERFLVDVMQIPWSQLHEEAVLLERGLSPTMEARIEAMVGHCRTCPHGNPVPGNSDTYPGDTRLDDAPAERPFLLQRIAEEAEEDSELIQFLEDQRLLPGTELIIAGRSETGLTLVYGGRTVLLPLEIGTHLWGDVV
jgi:DtxR family Mn-dependent transcriptional regulator